jgi:sulfur carrier protein ThiS
MHRGSSKEARGDPRASETLPLSASPSPISIVVEVTRGGSVERHRVRVPPGTAVRVVLRQVGCAPEGSAVLVDGTSIPLDATLDRPTRLTVVPTFSGG